MFLIQQINSQPRQKLTLILSDGSSFDLTIEYKPLQVGWFITEISYQGFIINGMRITTNPNILYQYKNQIPFGLACFTDGNQEPMLSEDFSSGRSKLYILSAEEVDELTELYRGQIS